jgi:hypothetical protein
MERMTFELEMAGAKAPRTALALALARVVASGNQDLDGRCQVPADEFIDRSGLLTSSGPEVPTRLLHHLGCAK